MKIAIDLDGTAWRYADFFAEFAVAMRARGHEVGILTAHNVDDLPGDLAEWSLRGFPRPDFYVGSHVKHDHWAAWKRRKMREHGIDFLFDDFHSDTVTLVGKETT